jgi:hypothetical protein
MTNHYTIEILETKTSFKATYRDNNFKKIEHLRGPLSDNLLKHLGKAIPRYETQFTDYKSQFKETIKYNQLVQVKSLYTLFLDHWMQFYQAFSEMPAKFTGADGKALKSIITHLKSLSAGNDTEALALWQLILEKWNTLSDFHQENTDLKYINSKLNIILNAIKRQNNTITGKSGGSVQL